MHKTGRPKACSQRTSRRNHYDEAVGGVDVVDGRIVDSVYACVCVYVYSVPVISKQVQVQVQGHTGTFVRLNPRPFCSGPGPHVCAVLEGDGVVVRIINCAF